MRDSTLSDPPTALPPKAPLSKEEQQAAELAAVARNEALLADAKREPGYGAAVLQIVRPQRTAPHTDYFFRRWGPELKRFAFLVAALRHDALMSGHATGWVALDLSRGDVAAMAGISVATLNRWLRVEARIEPDGSLTAASAHPILARFVRREEYTLPQTRGHGGGVGVRYWINLADDPHPSDAERLIEIIRHPHAPAAVEEPASLETDASLPDPPARPSGPSPYPRGGVGSQATGNGSGNGQRPARAPDPGKFSPAEERAKDVDRVVNLTGDKKSRKRFEQLWDIAWNSGHSECWDNAYIEVEAQIRKRGSAIETPGAYFQTVLTAKLNGEGVLVPRGSKTERDEIRAQIRGSLPHEEDTGHGRHGL